MINPLISIIVPVFNVELYLRKCLDSIINQSFDNYELILVDDGSIDNSGNICDEYASLDQRIKVVHKKNGGVSSARNVGLHISNGDWILFVDADDYIPYTTLQYYSDIINNETVDMVLASYVEVDDMGEIINHDDNYFEKQICMLDCLKLFYLTDTTLFQGYIWNRLFRRSIILENNIKFNETIYFKEDGLFAVQYMVCCSQQCHYSSKVVYHYIQHNDSSQHQFNRIFSYKYLSNLDARILCLKSITQKYDDKNIIDLARFSILHFYHHALNRMKVSNSISMSLRVSLLFKVVNSLGLLFYIRFKMATFKGWIFSGLRTIS